MIRPRPRSRLRAALLLSAPLALWMGCFPPLEGATCETDQNCPSSQFCSAGVCQEGPRPQRSATMSAAASLGPSSTASVGQSLTLTFTITNTGTVILTNIAPTSVTAGGTVAGATPSGPSPASVDRLLPGASTSFTWTVTPGATGTLQLTAAAQGTASDTGEAVTASATSPLVTVQRPAQLEVSLSGPATISRGQAFTIAMTVTNRGDAPARNVAPGTPTVAKTGGAAATAGALPAAVTIDGGANATFQLTFTENGTASGTLSVTAGATGVDGNSSATVTGAPASWGPIAVQTAAALRVSSFTIPAIIVSGGTFNATVTVTNDGEAGAALVLPSPDPPTKAATGGADATTSTALTSGSIPGGASRTFTWTYAATGTGTLQLTTGATGKDANSGQTITAAPLNSNMGTVQAGGALTVTSFTIPATLTRGQSFNAVMVVTNTGGAAVNGVVPAPIPPTSNATGGAAATTPTTFTPVSIAAGANHTFTFIYTENGPFSGTLSFTAHATGTDSFSGNPVTSANATTNVAAVQQPATLAITAFSAQPNLSRGQTFQLSLTVQNTGEATANNVLPLPNPPSLTKTGGADATTSSSPAARSVAGGASTTFTWSYTENGTGTGTLRFTAGAAGTDANDGSTVTAGTLDSNTLTVQTPATLVITSFTATSPIVRGSTGLTVTLMVLNAGQATANNVLPDPPSLTATGGANATTSNMPAAQTIAGSASTTFTWTYTENGTATGTLRFSTQVSGTDANSGAAVSSPSTNSNLVTVQ